MALVALRDLLDLQPQRICAGQVVCTTLGLTGSLDVPHPTVLWFVVPFVKLHLPVVVRALLQ